MRWVVVAVVRVSGVCWYATLDPLNLAFAVQRGPRQSRNGLCGPEAVLAVQTWARDGFHGPEATIASWRQLSKTIGGLHGHEVGFAA